MRYRVWAVNQRGYGRTTRPTQVGDYALPHLVDDVTALINAASAKSVVLIGHDWGAMVAWCFAAEQLHPLERLVIMNGPNPLCFRTAFRHWRQMRRSWCVAFFQLLRLAERILTGNGGAIVRRMFGGVALPPGRRRQSCHPAQAGRAVDQDLPLHLPRHGSYARLR
jgi:pimeloyl-ACP methyl ester carboxylesterase